MNYTNEFVEEDIVNYTVVQSPTRKKRRKKTSNKKVEKRAGIKGDDPCSIENCIKLSRKLPGLKPYSPQFYLGIRLMAKPQYRETFIALSDDPNQQLGWLKSFKLDDMNLTMMNDYETDNDTEYEEHEKDYESAVILAIYGVANYYLRYVLKQEKRTSKLSGYQWLLELKEGNEMRFFEQFRMRKLVFNRLCNDLVLNYDLKSTHVSGEEMVATFLYMLGQGAFYRMLEEQFQH
ncbi:hypothetical protein HN51_042292 [Arachis hypogaea]